MVVRNRHHSARAIQTGIGPVSVQVPKVRSRQGKPVVFRSSLVPLYVRKPASLDAAQWLYLKGVWTGECSLLGPETHSLSGSTVSRLKHVCRAEILTYRKLLSGV